MNPAHRLLAAGLLTLCLLPTADAQTQRSSGSWFAECTSGSNSYCIASTRIESPDAPYRFILRVSRSQSNGEYELALLTGREHPAEGAGIVVQVDGRKAMSLTPPDGYRRAGRSNTYLIAARETARLLQQMRTGKRMQFRYTDARGEAVVAAFPLAGFASAFAFIEERQPAPRAESPKPQTPPVRSSAQPAPESEAASAVPAPAPATQSGPAPGAKPAPIEGTKPPAVEPAQRAGAEQVRPAPAAGARPAPARETPPAPAKELPPARLDSSATEQPLPAPTSTARTAAATQPAPAEAASAGETPSQAAGQAAPEPKQAADSARTSKQRRAQKAAVASAAPPPSRKRGARSFRQFSCLGNEPSWTLMVDNDAARYAPLGDSGEPDPVELAGKLRVTGEGPTPVIDWRGKSDWGAAYRAVITEERCTDAIPDGEFRAQVSLPGGQTLRGCCKAGLEPIEPPQAAFTDTTRFPVADLAAKPENDWSRHLGNLLPGIQTCLDRTPEPAPYATKAWSMSRGSVGVRTRNRGGGWFECVAAAEGLRVDRFDPLPSGSQRAPNEDRVIFTPPDLPPPSGDCYRHERVMNGMGDFQGWLSTNQC